DPLPPRADPAPHPGRPRGSATSSIATRTPIETPPVPAWIRGNPPTGRFSAPLAGSRTNGIRKQLRINDLRAAFRRRQGGRLPPSPRREPDQWSILAESTGAVAPRVSLGSVIPTRFVSVRSKGRPGGRPLPGTALVPESGHAPGGNHRGG